MLTGKFYLKLVDLSEKSEAPKKQPIPSSSSDKKNSKKKEKGNESKNHIDEVPPQTLSKFEVPKIKDPKERHNKYHRKAPMGDLGAAQFIVDDEPFFDTFDHSVTVLGLQNLRKKKGVPFLKLQSIRPFFPFFVKT